MNPPPASSPPGRPDRSACLSVGDESLVYCCFAASSGAQCDAINDCERCASQSGCGVWWYESSSNRFVLNNAPLSQHMCLGSATATTVGTRARSERRASASLPVRDLSFVVLLVYLLTIVRIRRNVRFSSESYSHVRVAVLPRLQLRRRNRQSIDRLFFLVDRVTLTVCLQCQCLDFGMCVDGNSYPSSKGIGVFAV